MAKALFSTLLKKKSQHPYNAVHPPIHAVPSPIHPALRQYGILSISCDHGHPPINK